MKRYFTSLLFFRTRCQFSLKFFLKTIYLSENFFCKSFEFFKADQWDMFFRKNKRELCNRKIVPHLFTFWSLYTQLGRRIGKLGINQLNKAQISTVKRYIEADVSRVSPSSERFRGLAGCGCLLRGVDELSRWWKSGDLNMCLAFIDSMRVKSAELKDRFLFIKLAASQISNFWLTGKYGGGHLKELRFLSCRWPRILHPTVTE